MKILCIGRNYALHAKELNNEIPTEPVVFLKPETSLNTSNEFLLPPFSEEIHYEAEIVLRVCKSGKNIKEEDALNHFDALTLGIDFTARDIQRDYKAKGLPWEKAKAFDQAAYVADFLDKQNFNLENIQLELKKNSSTVQIGSSRDMLFDFATIIAHCSNYFTLVEGDYIFTGTPEGVGQVMSGDTLSGYLNQKEMFHLQIK